MSKLEDDLERYSDEAFNKGDVKSGLKLIREISGIVALAGLAFTVITVWIPALNIVIPGAMLAKGLSMAAKEYSNLDEEQRRQIRAVAKLARGGIGGIFTFLKD